MRDTLRMATFSDARAVYGLSATATPTSTNANGSITVGVSQTPVRFSDADVAHSLRAILCGSGDELVVDLTDCDTTGSTAFVAGTAQVETNTVVAASGCASNGTMTLVLTSAGMTGSPLNVAVALTTAAHTTAALIAAAARTALSAVAVIAARFTVGGTGADIVLTRLPTSTFTVSTGTLSLYAANDATLNLAIPSGLGVTASATSTNTTAGVLTSGAKLYDGDGLDAEGVTLPSISVINGLLLECANGEVAYDDFLTETGALTGNNVEGSKGIREFITTSPSTTLFAAGLTFSAVTEPVDLTLTVIGTTA